MRKSGFSLVELLVVVAIIGILSMILVPNVQEHLRRAKITKTKALIESLEVALAAYKNDFRKYPESFNPQFLYSALVEEAKAGYEPESREVRLIRRGDPIWIKEERQSDDRREKVLQMAGVPSSALRAQEDGYVFVDAWNNPLYYISSDVYNPGGRADFRRAQRNTKKFDAPCAYEMRDGKRYRPFNPRSFQIISFGPDETTITPKKSNGGIGSMINGDKVDNDGDGYVDNEDRIRGGSIESNDPDVIAEDDITNFM